MAGIARGAFIHRGEPGVGASLASRAYNDWLIEEWADVSPRFVPLCIAPMWGRRGGSGRGAPRAPRARPPAASSGTGPPRRWACPHFNEASWDPLWSGVRR